MAYRLLYKIIFFCYVKNKNVNNSFVKQCKILVLKDFIGPNVLDFYAAS